MSTRIWNAARVPVGRYHEFVQWVKEHTLPIQGELYKTVFEGVEGETLFDKQQAALKVLKLIHEFNNRFTLPTPCLWGQVYLTKKWAHIIFIGNPEIDPKDFPPYAEDYHYQNQTDPPEWVEYPDNYEDRASWPESFARWRERGDAWDKLLDKRDPLTTVAFWDWNENGVQCQYDIEKALKIGMFQPKSEETGNGEEDARE